MTKYRRLGDLHNMDLFLTVLEAEKVKIKVLAGLLSGKGSLPASQMAIFSLCPHMAKVSAGPAGTLSGH